jgi:hypothetical protein
MGKLNQVADGVWVRQSEWVWTNSIAVRGEDGLILIDPGIDGGELNQLADDVDRLDIPVVAGFSTGTTCSGIPGSATCRATPPPPPPTLPVKPESGRRRWRRRARPASLST